MGNGILVVGRWNFDLEVGSNNNFNLCKDTVGENWNGGGKVVISLSTFFQKRRDSQWKCSKKDEELRGLYRLLLKNRH